MFFSPFTEKEKKPKRRPRGYIISPRLRGWHVAGAGLEPGCLIPKPVIDTVPSAITPTLKSVRADMCKP